jgi:excisionase family DNA binding protein
MSSTRPLSPSTRGEIRTVLERAGLPDDPVRFLELVKAAVGSIVSARIAPDPSALTAHETAELRDIGLNPSVSTSKLDRASQATAAKMMAILVDSLTVEQAADVMRLHPSRLRQMLSDRTLYGIKDGGGWRVPTFQFAGGRQVRNIGPVLRAAPQNLHPVELLNWLTRPERALPIEGNPASPIQWLELGGDVEPVAAIAAEL